MTERRQYTIILYKTFLVSLLFTIPVIAASPVYVTDERPYLEAGQFAYSEPINVEGRIRRMFPEEPDTMVRIAQCESGLNQDAVSPTRDFGVLQINEASWDTLAIEMGLDYKNSVEDNLKMARYIYDKAGKNSWVCWWRYLA